MSIDKAIQDLAKIFENHRLEIELKDKKINRLNEKIEYLQEELLDSENRYFELECEGKI